MCIPERKSFGRNLEFFLKKKNVGQCKLHTKQFIFMQFFRNHYYYYYSHIHAFHSFVRVHVATSTSTAVLPRCLFRLAEDVYRTGRIRPGIVWWLLAVLDAKRQRFNCYPDATWNSMILRLGEKLKIEKRTHTHTHAYTSSSSSFRCAITDGIRRPRPLLAYYHHKIILFCMRFVHSLV